jgi:glycosyltransferase involved in cell wall biosynthesis
LKVIHVITRLELGGAQQNTLYTVSHLDRKRFAPALVTHPEGLLANGGPEGVETVYLPTLVREVRPLLDLRALFGLYRIFRREVKARRDGEPLVVHTHSSKAGILGRTAARMAGVPIVIHSIHGFGFHDRQHRAVRAFYLLLERIVSRWTHHYIAVSQDNIEEGVGLGLFGRDDVTLIRSGIDIDAFRGRELDREKKRSSLGLQPGQKLVGMVACFKPQKNPVDFVRLAGLVAKEIPEARFIMAGDGELRPAVEAAVADGGLDGKVFLLGWRRDVEEIIPALDILVLTSLWEGLPRVFPQAMAAGRPVVAYRVNGAPEAVSDGESGFLVDPGDYRAAAARVTGLLRDPIRAEAMGAAGAARVGEFDADLMVKMQEDLYSRLAASIASRTRRA